MQGRIAAIRLYEIKQPATPAHALRAALRAVLGCSTIRQRLMRFHVRYHGIAAVVRAAAAISYPSGVASARAVSFCVPQPPPAQLMYSGLGVLEAALVDHRGRLFVSSQTWGGLTGRIHPNGDVDRRWARVWSANGLAIDPSGQYLYGTRTFTRAGIWRLEIAEPTRVSTYASPAWPAAAALLDGITIDGTGRLYVAANGAGQIWRVDTDGKICALARGLRFPSAVALGRGPEGFHAGALYAVTFNGDIVAVPIGTS